MRLALFLSPYLILLPSVGFGSSLPTSPETNRRAPSTQQMHVASSGGEPRANLGALGAALRDVALHASYIVPSAVALTLGLRLIRAEEAVEAATKQTGRVDNELSGLRRVVGDNANLLQSDLRNARQLLRAAGNDPMELRKVDALLDKVEHGLRQTGGGAEYSVREWVAPDDMDADIEECVRREAQLLVGYFRLGILSNLILPPPILRQMFSQTALSRPCCSALLRPPPTSPAASGAGKHRSIVSYRA
jgi:hypothetical protein